MTEAYARLGIPLLRTDRHGAVSVIGTPSGFQVNCQSGRQFKRVILGSGGDRTGKKSEAHQVKRWVGLSESCDNSLYY
jgi:hypothetical protein